MVAWASKQKTLKEHLNIFEKKEDAVKWSLEKSMKEGSDLSAPQGWCFPKPR